MAIIGFDHKDMIKTNKLHKKEFMLKALIQSHQILKLVEKVIFYFFHLILFYNYQCLVYKQTLDVHLLERNQ